MARIDWFRTGLLVAALVAFGFALSMRAYLRMDVSVAQTLVGAFSVLAGFLVSALAFVRPIDPSSLVGLSQSQEMKKKIARLSFYFYLYLANVFGLILYSILRDSSGGEIEILGSLALSLSLASLIASAELPRLILQLREFQS